MAELPEEIIRELQRQREKWGNANRLTYPNPIEKESSHA